MYNYLKSRKKGPNNCWVRTIKCQFCHTNSHNVSFAPVIIYMESDNDVSVGGLQGLLESLFICIFNQFHIPKMVHFVALLFLVCVIHATVREEG